jgi:hypothetical protein
MGPEGLLAISNKSLIFKNQMKKDVSEKKELKFGICQQHNEICFTEILQLYRVGN